MVLLDVASGDWSSVITPITDAINVSSISSVLVTAATTAVVLVFMWWGVRKVTQVIMSAFRKGKLRI